MKKWALAIGIGAAIVLVAVLSQRGNAENEIRRLLEDMRIAALEGFDREDPSVLDNYFATIQEGAQDTGLTETIEAFKIFVTQLSGESVQIHSFDIEQIAVHEEGGLARVSYKMHLSVIRGNAAVFTVRFTQNLAIMKTSRGWRVSGGDSPQIEETTGIWPSR